ncbi:MAG: YdcH family protein [Candidatus Puniceispirillales bacterium]|tara:strand:- start:233 stop:436 length:204 start_codon:yes stop_codon:yes gene_type:complete
MTYDQSRLKEKLNELINQHSELDDAIERINEKIPFDQVKLQRLKKRKLVLKDEIKKLNSQILPDIIA